MNSNDKNRCIRSCRDENQINRSREFIKSLHSSLSLKAKIHAMLSNPVRLKILYLLKKESRLCVCDISEILDMSIPAISQHLKKLRSEKIVFTEREGNTIYNRMNSKFFPLLRPQSQHNAASLILAYES